MAAGAPTAWTHYAAVNLRRWLNAFVAEARMRQQATAPDPATYLPIRRISIGMFMFADMTERVCGFDLPEYLHTSSVFRDLHESMADIIAFTNDIYSLEFETALGDTVNLVPVLTTHEGCSVDQAVDKISTLVHPACDKFTSLAAQLPELACDTADRHIAYQYTTMVRDQAQGTEAWVRRTKRYPQTPAYTG
ncbi:terpene synthase family protein [Nocardia thraciensis]